MGGKFHPKLNIRGKPIAHKYREGKVKRTLKRELKVLETAKSKGQSLLVAYGSCSCSCCGFLGVFMNMKAFG